MSLSSSRSPLFALYIAMYGAAMWSTTSAAPNIFFLMADDLGWGNVGFHNADNPQIMTPVMDELVQQHALELTRHYVASDSSPTRSSFQSGRLPIHINSNDHRGTLNPFHGLPSSMTTIASKLKSSEYNYKTHMIGKWDCGFATFDKLPINKGYDTFYGYLTSSIDYFQKTMMNEYDTRNQDGLCQEMSFHDFWSNGQPMYSSNDQINTGMYSEYEFSQRVMDILDDHVANTPDTPFFIMYSSHLPHSPLQLPEDYITSNEMFVSTPDEDDEAGCFVNDVSVNPTETALQRDPASTFGCRQLLQGQVNLLDAIIGDIVQKLKSLDLWDNTLLIVTTDNGGSLQLDHTAGNNYPLRGAKFSEFEGGIRATTFVTGGYLPPSRRGQKEAGLMHVADWYRTLCEMLNIDATDELALNAGLPDVDGYNMWPLIAGEISESPRSVLPISKNVLISGAYKLNIGDSTHNKFAIWPGPLFPNSSTPSQEALSSATLDCAENAYGGCLFDVVADPTEHNNLARDRTYFDLMSSMKQQLLELQAGFYKNNQEGTNSCPADFNQQTWNVDDETQFSSCSCWMAKNNYNQFMGPYQDLSSDEIHWVEPEGKTSKRGPRKLNFHSYIVLVIVSCAVVIIVTSICLCIKFKEKIFTSTQPEGGPVGGPYSSDGDNETTPLLQQDNNVAIGDDYRVVL